MKKELILILLPHLLSVNLRADGGDRNILLSCFAWFFLNGEEFDKLLSSRITDN